MSLKKDNQLMLSLYQDVQLKKVKQEIFQK